MTQKRDSWIRVLLVTVLVFVLLWGITVYLMDALSRTSDEEQVAIVTKSLHHALLTCYAVEGGYPEDIEYLKTHYGLLYDSDRISIYYDLFASNIMPDVHVSLRGADAQ